MRSFALAARLAPLFLLLIIGTAFAQTPSVNPAASAYSEKPVEAGLLPNNFFYAFERFMESAQLFFTFGTFEKAQLRLRFAEKRLAECNALVAAGQPGYCADLMADYEKSTRATYEVLNATSASFSRLSDVVRDSTVRHATVLRVLLTKVPDSAKPAIGRALNASLEGQQASSVLRLVIREEAARIVAEQKVAERVRAIVENATGANLTLEQRTRAEVSAKEEVKGILKDVEGVLVSEAERYIRERNTTDIREILGAIRSRAEARIENITPPIR